MEREGGSAAGTTEAANAVFEGCLGRRLDGAILQTRC